MYKSNDEIHEQLELLKEYINLAPDDGFAVVERILKNKNPKPVKRIRIKGYGTIPGKSHSDLVKECIELLTLIRYQKTKQVFRALSQLLGHEERQRRDEAKKAIETLSKYEQNVLNQVGYRPQLIILDEVETWKAKKVSQHLEGIVTAMREILDAGFEGQTSEYKEHLTLTMHFGALRVSDALTKIRSRAIKILKNAYLNSTNVPDKAKIIKTLQHATQTPSHGGYDEDMETMIIKDTESLIGWYVEILPNADSEIIQDIEEQKIWFMRRFGKEKLPKLVELEEAIATHKGYSIFRVFVGYDGQLDPEFDYNKTRQERIEKINEFVDNITEENFESWREKLVLVLKNYTEAERGAYSYFDTFLQELGKKKPNLALRILNANEKEFQPFLLSLIAGLWQSGSKTEIKNKALGWIDAGENLRVCAAICMVVGEVDVELLEGTLQAAKKAKDEYALTSLLRTLSDTYPASKDLKWLFVATIKELTKLKNTWWVNHAWYKAEGMLQELTLEEYEIVLENMEFLSSIDYHSEEILKLIAEKDPARIIDFLHKRVGIEAKNKKKNREANTRYDAIPYDLHKLPSVLKKHEDIVVPKLLQWFADGGEKHNWFFRWEAGSLLADLFPGFTPALEKALTDLVEKKTKESRRIVLIIIGKYEHNNDAIWRLVRVLVNTYVDNKKIYEEVRGTLFGYLMQTGVVTGEYGLRDAYKAKKDALKRFKGDEDKNFAKFVDEYEKYLERSINLEQKRTDAEVEMMKRDFS